MAPLLAFNNKGIYCEAGDFYIDPWKAVDRAVITHGHSDHAKRGMKSYLAHRDSEPILRLRLGKNIQLETVAYDEPVMINGVKVSLHPAGHIIGSAQVRVEYKGEIWVASGDYKIEDDGLTPPFEPIRCHAFISETTFGLPVYRWRPQEEVLAAINAWWAQNAAEGRPSVIHAYALGKAQRLLQSVDPSIGPLMTHSTVENVNEAFREIGWNLNKTTRITAAHKAADFQQALIVAPGSAIKGRLEAKLGDYSLGMVSGWMAHRKGRFRRPADRGFVLSDHADWDGLNEAIRATGAEKIILTHGYASAFARWLRSQGLDAQVEASEFEGEEN
ncbi:MAG: ligase-associated DNA damage response exonuclease [Bacteroidia bacterium]